MSRSVVTSLSRAVIREDPCINSEGEGLVVSCSPYSERVLLRTNRFDPLGRNAK